VLQLTAWSPAQSRRLLELLGSDGTLTVVEPDRYRAAAVAELRHEGLQVVGYSPDGHETFGQHDALLAAPFLDPRWPLNRFGQLARRNLRPGGRFVLDLPGEQHCQPVDEAWREVGAPVERLGAWNGPAEASVARILRADGLRQVEPAVGTYLLRFSTPLELADAVVQQLGGDEALVASLRLAFARRFASNEVLELVFRR